MHKLNNVEKAMGLLEKHKVSIISNEHLSFVCALKS